MLFPHYLMIISCLICESIYCCAFSEAGRKHGEFPKVQVDLFVSQQQADMIKCLLHQ